jgi:hypothetical protein
MQAFDIGVALDLPDRFGVVGNSYLKVRQYLATGKHVITCAEEDSFLARENLAYLTHPFDLESMKEAIRAFHEKSTVEKGSHCSRVWEYAKSYLSVNAALNQCVAFWERCLKAL